MANKKSDSTDMDGNDDNEIVVVEEIVLEQDEPQEGYQQTNSDVRASAERGAEKKSDENEEDSEDDDVPTQLDQS